MSSFTGLRVALVHDWFTVYGGAERVIEQMLEVLPQADCFALIDDLPASERGFLGGRAVTTSGLQRWGFLRKRYRSLLPWMPKLIEQFDFSDYDLVVSSSSCVAKGVITGPDQVHLSYCYSPMRYAWDLQHQYLREAGLQRGIKGRLARRALHRLRIWDAVSAQRPDRIVTLSRYIARRIGKCWGRAADVVYPPVAVDDFPLHEDQGDYFVTASRMVPYKRIPLVVEAFAGMPDRRLVVIGDGPDMPKVRRLAEGAGNISILGRQSHAVLREHLQGARAFVFAAEEDFGIAPIEASACGTPVIAYGRGGATETVVDGVSGCFFPRQDVAAIRAAVQRFDAADWDAAACRGVAESFAPQHFRAGFARAVEEALNGRRSGPAGETLSVWGTSGWHQRPLRDEPAVAGEQA